MSSLKLKHRLDLSAGKRRMLLNDAMDHKLQDSVIIFSSSAENETKNEKEVLRAGF
jgi:hypothetical protein